MGLGAETLFEAVLNISSMVMGFAERNGAIHTDMSLDGNTVANLAGTQVMRLSDIRT